MAAKTATMTDDRYRGLITDREREILTGEADVADGYRYRVISRVRTKIEQLEDDIEVLEATHDTLADELREVVCDPDADTDEGGSEE